MLPGATDDALGQVAWTHAHCLRTERWAGLNSNTALEKPMNWLLQMRPKPIGDALGLPDRVDAHHL